MPGGDVNSSIPGACGKRCDRQHSAVFLRRLIFAGFADPVIGKDGAQSLWLKLETDSRTLNLAIPFAEIGDAIQFLAGCSEFAVSNSDHADDAIPPRLEKQEWAPIPARGFGLGAGRTPDETILMIQLSCCQLAFPIPGKDLIWLADDFARTAQTLSAGLGKSN